MVYAQYRLGAQLLELMPPELKRTVGRFRQLYDMGLHGPGLLAYQGQGEKFLHQSGEVFFERVCRILRMDRSEGAMAYLYGLVAHYALSSAVSEYLRQTSQAQGVSVRHICTEFDRFLLEKDGKSPAYQYDRSRHINLTPGECETVAMFYPGISPGVVGKAVKHMARSMHLPAIPAGSKRDLVLQLMKLGKEQDLVMALHPDHRLKVADEQLLQLYRQARENYPALLVQIQTRLRKNVPFDEAFSPPFA